MAFITAKPGKYTTCICCKGTECLTEYQFGDVNSVRLCVTLCCKCVANMYIQSVSHKEAKDDKRPENN